MELSSGSNDAILGSIVGKHNKRKISKIYNDAFDQISKLWSLLPDSARLALHNGHCDSDNLQVEDKNMHKSKIISLESRVNSLKGKLSSYKDKMTKKKFQGQLKKKQKQKERAELKLKTKEEMRFLKKELKKLKNAERLKDETRFDGPLEKQVDDVTKDLENLSAIDLSNSKNTSPAENRRVKKNKKNIEEILISEVNESRNNENQSGLSKKKQKLLLTKQLKAMKKKERKNQLKIKKREEDAAKVVEIAKTVEAPKLPKNDNDEVLYNKIDLEGEEVVQRFKKEKLRAEKDPVKALSKIEELNQKITNLKVSGQEEKAKAIQSREAWKKAILKADGVKVKDDIKLLKKAIRRKEKKKNKSKEEWIKRKDVKEKKMADAQKKRKENIQKKKNDKKQKKVKKSIKKGRIVI